MTTPKKRGPGRPPGSGQYPTRIFVKCSAAQRNDWQRAAEAEGMTLSDWVRRELDLCADGVGVEPVTPDGALDHRGRP